MLWREWRYCELGAAVAGVALPNAASSSTAASNWWGGITNTSVLSSAAQAAGTAPASCTVPAVPGENAGDPNARGAVTYYTLTDAAANGLAAEELDGSKQWTATLVHTTASGLETAESLY